MKFLTLALICALGTAAEGQDRSDWQSLARLQTGDSVRLFLKAGPVSGAFKSWTPQEVMAGSVTARREDVLKIERYRDSSRGRGKTALVGGLIGFGAGFAVGAAVTGCKQNQFGPCITRVGGGAIAGGAGLVLGAAIGALLPRRHTKEIIYAVK